MVDDIATNEITREYEAHKDVLEDTKKRVLFPHSTTVLGGDGVYTAFEDFWLEFASGAFNVELAPNGVVNHSTNTRPKYHKLCYN